MSEEFFYNQLPDEMLALFYIEILRKLNKNQVTETLHENLQLIEITARKRHLTLEQLEYIGTKVSNY